MSPTTDQDGVFLAGEGDAWYRRNAALLSEHRRDPVIAVLAVLDRREDIASVCDLGCADGWRLAALQPLLPAATRLAGVDPGAQAVAAGRARWPGLELAVGTLAEHPVAGPFDLVLVCGVFCWVDRAALAASVAAVDRLVCPGGLLVVADFAAEAPTRRPYHHRRDVALFTHKQDHPALFRALGTYRQTFSMEWNHAEPPADGVVPTALVPDGERWGVSVLVKAP